MKFFIILALIISSLPSAFSQSRWEGVTPYGYSVKKMIERYDNHSNSQQTHIDATIDFIHIYYANAMALEMVKRANDGKAIKYYCQEQTAKKATEEMELFISWVKLKAAKDKSILDDPITTLFPMYLNAMYPLSNCETND
jgi:hypothetical protein